MPAGEKTTRLRLAGQRLTLRGWSVLAGSVTAIVVAYSTGWRSLLYIGFTLLLLVVLSVLWARSRSGRLSIDRQVTPDLVAAQSNATVTLRAHNLAWVPSTAGFWRDIMPDELEAPSWRPLAPIAPRGAPESRISLSYTIATQRRGRFPIGPFSVRGSDPFGVSIHERTSGSVDEIIVLPRLFTLDGASASPVATSDSASRATMMGRGQDDVIAREYRVGDALRHVHWRASAHRGELMVRQEQRQDDARSIVLLDNRRDRWAQGASFEWAVSFAASVIAHLSADGSGATLVLTAPESASGYDLTTPRESLIELATIGRRSSTAQDYLSVLGSLQGSGPAPIVAIVGRMEPAEWRELAGRRAPRSAAAAVVVGGEEAPDSLWAAGWQVVSVPDAAADMAEMWRAASMGRSRV